MVLKQKKFAVPSGTTFRTGSQAYRTNYLKQATLVKTYRNSGDASHADDDIQPDVEYSLNKKGRWNLPKQIREEFRDCDEKISLRQFHKIKRKARCVSYEANKGPVVKVSPKKHYFDIGSLEPKKRAGKEDDVDVVEAAEPEPGVEVVYSLYLPAGSRSAITYNPKYIDVPVYANAEGDGHLLTAVSKKGRPTKNRSHRIDDYDFRDSDWSMEDDFETVEDVDSDLDYEGLEGATSSDYWGLGDGIDGFIDIALQRKEFEKYEKVKREKTSSPPSLDVKDRKIYIDSPEISRKKSDAAFVEPDFPALAQCISATLPMEQTGEDSLVEKFGVSYAEACTIPRRFVIDVSEKIKDDVTCYVAFEESGSDVNQYRIWVQSTTPCALDQPGQTSLTIDDVITHVCDVIRSSEQGPTTNRKGKKKGRLRQAFEEKRHAQFDSAMNKLIGHPVTFTNLKKACGWTVHTTDPSTIAPLSTTYVVPSRHVPTNPQSCSICTESRDGTGMTSCGHVMCEECWVYYADSVLKTGAGKVSCPAYDCSAELTDAFVQTLVHPDLFRKYQVVKLDTFLATNKWSWCPNMCGRVVKTEAKGTSGRFMNVDCECRLNVCADCKNPSHWPATCEQARNYRDMLKERGDEVSRVFTPSVLVKFVHCPHCFRPVEKVVGCNYVFCLCQKSFCWQCGTDYGTCSEESGNYGGCKRVARKEAELEYIPPPGTPGTGQGLYAQAVHHHHKLNRQCRVNSAKHFNKLIKRAMNSVRKMSTAQGDKMEVSSRVIQETKTDLQQLENSALEVLNELHHCAEYTTVAILFRTPRSLPQQKVLEQHVDKIHFVTQRFHQLLQTAERPPSEITEHIRNYVTIGRSFIVQLVSALRLNKLV